MGYRFYNIKFKEFFKFCLFSYNNVRSVVVFFLSVFCLCPFSSLCPANLPSTCLFLSSCVWEVEGSPLVVHVQREGLGLELTLDVECCCVDLLRLSGFPPKLTNVLCPMHDLWAPVSIKQVELLGLLMWKLTDVTPDLPSEWPWRPQDVDLEPDLPHLFLLWAWGDLGLLFLGLLSLYLSLCWSFWLLKSLQ